VFKKFQKLIFCVPLIPFRFSEKRKRKRRKMQKYQCKRCTKQATCMGDNVYCDSCTKEIYRRITTTRSPVCANVTLGTCASVAGFEPEQKFRWLTRGWVMYKVQSSGFLKFDDICSACAIKSRTAAQASADQSMLESTLNMYKDICKYLQEKCEAQEIQIELLKQKRKIPLPLPPAKRARIDPDPLGSNGLEYIPLDSADMEEGEVGEVGEVREELDVEEIPRSEFKTLQKSIHLSREIAKDISRKFS
jgi:hypothetical protein